ncbi:MAG: O-antigen ligase family protein [Acidobacteriota bacterium]|nr:MAG: O-antigen ligase family protein [Acidobacteriota bacterium]
MAEKIAKMRRRESRPLYDGEYSRMNTAVFLLLLFIPAAATILFGGVDNNTWALIQILWVVIVALWAAEAWRTDRLSLPNLPLVLPILGLAAVGFIQLLPIAGIASQEPINTRLLALKLLIFATFLAASFAFIDTDKRIKRVAMFVVIFGSLLAFFGILQRLANPDGIYGLRETPQAIPFGPFVNQHHFASFMQMTGGVALGLVFGRTLSRNTMLLIATGAVLMGTAVAMTSSRGGMLGFAAMLVVVAFLSLGRQKRTSEDAGIFTKLRMNAGIVIGAAAIILLILGTVLFVGGDESLLRGVGAARPGMDISTGRFHFWPIAIQIFLANPILGAGLDAFGVAFTRYDTWNGALRVEQAHNEYLQMLADAGVVGFLLLAAFILMFFRKASAVIASAHGSRRAIAAGAFAGCFGILIHSFFDFPLRTFSNGFFFLLLVVLATQMTDEKEATRS